MFILLAFLLLSAFIGTSMVGIAAPNGSPAGNIKSRSFSYYDLQKQVGDLSDDFRQMMSSLMGATQVVYWKKPTNRIAPYSSATTTVKRRVKVKPAKYAAASHKKHPVPKPTSVKRKKKALHSDYDDLIAMDTWSFFR